MASRRRAREFAVQALYRADLLGVDVQTSLNHLWSGLLDDEGVDDQRAPESAEMEFAAQLALGAERDQEALDTLIEQCSTNWRVPRMPVVDRNILRLAAHELRSFDDIPATVTINEAVELAKTFGGGDSRAFVNGIVDRMARTLGRLQGERPRRR